MYNAEQIIEVMKKADKEGVKVLVFPELSLTGATCGDLFLQETLLRDYHYIFAPHDYPGLPEANLHEIDGESSFVPVPGIEVVPIKVMHKNLPILGYRIGDLAYITDANYIEPKEMKKLQGVRLLVLNALRREKHWSHYCLPEALDIIEKVKPEQAFLTHISHELGLHDIVEKELPEGVHLAYDNLSVEI